jgi:hypothetical protein
MDAQRFDRFTRRLARAGSRREFLQFGASVPVVALVGKGRSKPASLETEAKVTLCHKPGTPESEVITVADSAVAAHFEHGDIVRVDCCPGDTCLDPFASCGGGGVPGRCGCTPTTCEALKLSCGTADDGCGGEVDCGPCCLPATCADLGDACGQVPDGCEGTLDCGPCCDRQTCEDLGVECGPATDGCGGDLDCGPCVCEAEPAERSCFGACNTTRVNNCGDEVVCPPCPICRKCFTNSCVPDTAQIGQSCADGKVCCGGGCVTCLASGTVCVTNGLICSTSCRACCHGASGGVCL